MIAHVPVMKNEALEGLAIRPNGTYWDGTFGRGGHSLAILERLDEKGRLIASDRDEQAEAVAMEMNDTRLCFYRGTLEEALSRIEEPLAGFLWDLGCSTPQLKDATRGFSFSEAGPLDMRMDQKQELTAADLINETPEKELADLIYKYGEERFSRRISARIVAARTESRIENTLTLAEICRSVYPKKRHHRIHPATRTFQALRIATNDELDQLESSLPIALERLSAHGRAVVISFHSLEDRIVKHTFRPLAKEGRYRIITKRPLQASELETGENPASRSAKLRILERLTVSDGENS